MKWDDFLLDIARIGIPTAIIFVLVMSLRETVREERDGENTNLSWMICGVMILALVLSVAFR